MAIAALATGARPDERRARVLQTAVGFAVGHAMVLGLGAVAAVAFGVVLPSSIESGAEALGGALLILFGLVSLWGVAAGGAFGHVHAETDGRRRWHLHFASVRHPHGHSKLPAIMGAVFAVSSLRALTLLQPFGGAASGMAVPALLLLVAVFGAGILLSMSLFGVLLARVLSLGAIQTVGRAAAGLVAIASIALGIYWIGV